jgi:hypothetical protein
MIDHGFKTCVLETLKYNQTDIRKRMKQDHVIELAQSMKQLLPLEPIVVHAKTKVLIAGRDRLAAHFINGDRTAWCHMVVAHAGEMESAERAENLYRRPIDRDALMAEEVAAREKTIKEAEEAAPEAEEVSDTPKKGGRKKTAKGKAREEVAKKAGKSPDAVRKAVERAEKKEKAKKEPKPTGIMADMAEIREAIGLVLRPLVSSQSATTKLLTLANMMGKDVEPALQRLKQRLHECAAVVRLLRPDKKCPHCKGERLIEGRDCSGCGAAGYLTEGAAQVPEAVAAE